MKGSLPLRRSIVVLLLLILLLGGFLAYWRSSQRGLPYQDSFAKGNANEWKAFGGTWELTDGAVRNDSDDRGAKLVTGSPYWRNYSVEANVSLLGSTGDAGLVIRSEDEEEGVNAYSGYYAGVRTIDNSLVLGRADYSWMETSKQSSVPQSIRPFTWYHLKLLAYDCQIVAELYGPSSASRASIGISDSDCIRSGKIGLRSYSSGGIWRNIVVRRATRQDLDQMLQNVRGFGETGARNTFIENAAHLGSRQSEGDVQTLALPNTAAHTIISLRLTSFAKPTIATVRGVVVLTAPRLYIQDSTGGVYVPFPKAPLLKVGDEVEVTGEVHPGDFSSTIEHATVRALWARTPMPPVSVTASQASTGKYDATFIEVQGRLTVKERGPDGTLILDLNDGPQSFRAIMNPGRSDYLLSQLKLNSSLRLRGVCVVDQAFTQDLRPFVLLLRSNEDLDVIAGPPWWSTGHIIAIVFTTLVLILFAVSVYHRMENWRLRAILEERERLAHEMHDTLAQSFAGIGFQLQAIRNGLTKEMPTLQQQLELASNLVRHSHEEARRSIATLRTEDLDSEDILTALDLCARRMVDGGLMRVIVEKEGNQRPIPLRIADTLYRIGQEAIANAVRHAQSTILVIRLKYGENSIRLQVDDNGIGFVQSKSAVGFGVRGMRRRAQSISAEFQIQSEAGRGTQLFVEAPLPPRVTFLSSPEFLWKYLREHWNNVRPKIHANSHSDRG